MAAGLAALRASEVEDLRQFGSSKARTEAKGDTFSVPVVELNLFDVFCYDTSIHKGSTSHDLVAFAPLWPILNQAKYTQQSKRTCAQPAMAGFGHRLQSEIAELTPSSIRIRCALRAYLT